MPSCRPVKPNFSVVVALMEMSSSSTSRTDANTRFISGMCGFNFGRSEGMKKVVFTPPEASDGMKKLLFIISETSSALRIPFLFVALHGKKQIKMKNNDWKSRLGVLYSTNPDFQYETNEEIEEETLPKEKQVLRVALDKRNRGGKVVTLITGFRGTTADLEALGKLLKVKCGVGGSAKDGEIIVQGDFRQKVEEILRKEGYTQVKVIR